MGLIMETKDNKPERTAMQQAIDAINNEAHKYPPGADERNALQLMLPKLVKLRDTVEKDRHKETWIEGFLYGVKGANGHIDGHPIRDGIQADMIGEKEYNYKYGTDGK